MHFLFPSICYFFCVQAQNNIFSDSPSFLTSHVKLIAKSYRFHLINVSPIHFSQVSCHLPSSSTVTPHLSDSRGSQLLSWCPSIQSVLHKIAKLIFQNKILISNSLEAGSGSPWLLRKKKKTAA